MRNLKPEYGFSLVEVMLALGMAGVVGLGAAYVVQSQVVQQKSVESKMDLAAAHAVALQSARNLKFIGDNVVVQTPATPTSPEIRNTALDRCLMAKPKATENCEGFSNIQGQRRKRLPNVMHDGGRGEIVSNIEAERICNANGCPKITVHVVTQRMNRAAASTGTGGSGATEAERLATDVDLPGMSFVPVEQMDQACAAGSVLTGYDNLTRQAICQPLTNAPDMNCSNTTNGPLLGFGTNRACSNIRSRQCPTGGLQGGVSIIGQGSGTIECGTVDTFAPPPTPTPVPTNQVACWSRNIGTGSTTGCDNSLQYYATETDCDNGSGPPSICNRAPFTSRCRAVQVGSPDAANCPVPPPPPQPTAPQCLANGTALPSMGLANPGDPLFQPVRANAQCCSGYSQCRAPAYNEPWECTCVSSGAPILDPPADPSAGCYDQFEVYFGWSCPGPTDSISMTCPNGQGTPQRFYGTHSAPAMCNQLPSEPTWRTQECRPCASATPSPPSGQACRQSVIFHPCKNTSCNTTDFDCPSGQVIERYRSGNVWGSNALISWNGTIAGLCIPAGTGTCAASPTPTPTPATTADSCNAYSEDTGWQNFRVGEEMNLDHCNQGGGCSCSGATSGASCRQTSSTGDPVQRTYLCEAAGNSTPSTQACYTIRHPSSWGGAPANAICSTRGGPDQILHRGEEITLQAMDCRSTSGGNMSGPNVPDTDGCQGTLTLKCDMNGNWSKVSETCSM